MTPSDFLTSPDPLTAADFVAPSPGPHVCLDCRTALGRDARCDADRYHVVVDLTTRAGLDALLAQVWGEARRLPELEITPPRPLLERLEDAFDDDVPATGWTMAGGHPLYRGQDVEGGYRVSGPPPRPQGAQARPRGRGRRHARAVVDGKPHLLSPLGHKRCLAWAIEFLCEDAPLAREVTLRAGQTVAFEMTLDDGDRLLVPAGRVRFSMPLAIPVRSGSRRRALAVVAAMRGEAVPPRRRYVRGDTADPFPFTHVRERVLDRRDRVEIAFEAERHEDPTGGPAAGAYRTAARTRLLATGIPYLTRGRAP